MSATVTQTTTPGPYKLTLAPEDEQKYAYSKLDQYAHPPETSESLPWAELVTLDLEDYSRPGGKDRLAAQLEHAVHHVGFFYVKNFSLNDEQVQQQFTLAKNFFNLPLEEKMQYECDFANGGYNGYRPSGRNKIGNVKDNVEIYNIPKFTRDFDGFVFLFFSQLVGGNGGHADGGLQGI